MWAEGATGQEDRRTRDLVKRGRVTAKGLDAQGGEVNWRRAKVIVKGLRDPRTGVEAYHDRGVGTRQ